MNKSILTLSIAVLLSSSLTIMAQEPQEEMPPMPAPGGYNHMPPRPIAENPLTRDLDLSEEQKAKLEALENPFLPQSLERRSAHQRQPKSPRELDQNREQAQSQDSLQCSDRGDGDDLSQSPVRRDGRMGARGAQTIEDIALVRAEYLRKVKKILTPEQYVKYMENLLVYMAPDPKSMGNFPAGNVHNRGPRSPHSRGASEQGR